MTHSMKLAPKPFEQIKNGEKRHELRLNDEKRQILKLGDHIEFTNIETNEKLTVEVISLTPYKDFEDLFEGLKSQYPSWIKEEFLKNMHHYYSEEDERRFGSLAIGIQKIEEGRWRGHAKQLKGIPPRQLLMEAVNFVTDKSEALDLGPGALSDTKYLLEQGFSHVTAVDIGNNAPEIASTLPKDRFDYVIASFEDYDFPKESFDLINAQYSLFFINPNKFSEVFEKIKKSLKPQGIFVGNLLGVHDSWHATKKNMSFHTREQIERLLTNMEVIKLEEEERDGRTASREQKHWHLFNIIARRK